MALRWVVLSVLLAQHTEAYSSSEPAGLGSEVGALTDPNLQSRLASIGIVARKTEATPPTGVPAAAVPPSATATVAQQVTTSQKTPLEETAEAARWSADNTPKAAAPKAEAPKAEAPKAGTPKAEAAKGAAATAAAGATATAAKWSTDNSPKVEAPVQPQKGVYTKVQSKTVGGVVQAAKAAASKPDGGSENQAVEKKDDCAEGDKDPDCSDEGDDDDKSFPKDIEASVKGPGSLVVQWKTPEQGCKDEEEGGCKSYTVFYREKEAPQWKEIKSTKWNVTQEIKELDGGSTIQVQLQVKWNKGMYKKGKLSPKLPATPIEVTMPVTPPFWTKGESEVKAATPRKPKRAKVTFPAVDNNGGKPVTSYEVYTQRQDIDDAEWKLKASVAPGAEQPTFTAEIKGLQPSTTYKVKVLAVNEAGETDKDDSDQHLQCTFKTAAPEASPSPSPSPSPDPGTYHKLTNSVYMKAGGSRVGGTSKDASKSDQEPTSPAQPPRWSKEAYLAGLANRYVANDVPIVPSMEDDVVPEGKGKREAAAPAPAAANANLLPAANIAKAKLAPAKQASWPKSTKASLAKPQSSPSPAPQSSPTPAQAQKKPQTSPATSPTPANKPAQKKPQTSPASPPKQEQGEAAGKNQDGQAGRRAATSAAAASTPAKKQASLAKPQTSPTPAQKQAQKKPQTSPATSPTPAQAQKKPQTSPATSPTPAQAQKGQDQGDGGGDAGQGDGQAARAAASAAAASTHTRFGGARGRFTGAKATAEQEAKEAKKGVYTGNTAAATATAAPASAPAAPATAPKSQPKLATEDVAGKAVTIQQSKKVEAGAPAPGPAGAPAAGAEGVSPKGAASASASASGSAAAAASTGAQSELKQGDLHVESSSQSEIFREMLDTVSGAMDMLLHNASRRSSAARGVTHQTRKAEKKVVQNKVVEKKVVEKGEKQVAAGAEASLTMNKATGSVRTMVSTAGHDTVPKTAKSLPKMATADKPVSKDPPTSSQPWVGSLLANPNTDAFVALPAVDRSMK